MSVQIEASAAGPIDMASSRVSRHDRLPAVDACRGIATVLVLGFHAELLPPWAAVGMDLFFVISGFVITRRLLGSYGLGWFWWRRFRRLVPALVVMIAGVGLISLTGICGGAPVGRDAAAGLAYVANWVQIRAGSNYWAAVSDESPLKHLWSLGVEEQFYVVWPLIVVGIAILAKHNKEKIRRGVGIVAPLLSLTAFVWTYRLSAGSALTRVYEGTDARAGALLLGSGLAAWWSPAPKGSRRSWYLLGVAGVLGVVLGVVNADNSPDRTTYWHSSAAVGVALVSFLVVAAAASPEMYTSWRVVALRPLKWLGQRSYGAYLWHWPLMLIADHWNVARVWALGVSLVLAEASHHLLEPPKLLERVPKRLGAQVLIAGTALSLAVAGAIAVRVDTPIDSARARAVPVILKSSSTTSKASGPGASATSAVPQAVYAQVLVLGDSVPNSLIDELVVAAPPGVSLIDDAYPNCDGAEDADEWNTRAPPGCADWRERWATLFPAEHPKTLALWFAGTGVSGATTGQFGKPGHVGQPAWDTWWGGTVEERVRALQKLGIDVVLVLPMWPDNTQAVAFFFGDDDFDQLLQNLRGTREIMSNVAARTGATTVDLGAIVCPEGPRNCRSDGDDGQALRPDGIHFDDARNGVRLDTKPRATWVARAVLEAAYQSFGLGPTG